MRPHEGSRSRFWEETDQASERSDAGTSMLARLIGIVKQNLSGAKRRRDAASGVSLVGEICGSPIRSNGRRKLGSRSPRTRCRIAQLQLFLFVASCLSN
jgi:hypothetical protein